MDSSYTDRHISYQKYLSLVMKWMFIGVGLTALTSIFIISIGFHRLNEGLFYSFLIASSVVEIIMVFILAKKVYDLSIQSAKICFYIYSILNGVTLSLLLSMISPIISILAFALTCVFFGLLYVIVTHTSFDFTHIGSICLLCLPVLLIGYLILFFINAPALFYGIIFIDLVMFTGITLYDLQKLEEHYHQSTDEMIEGVALISALCLYMDFINIFIDILIIVEDNA